MPAEAAQIDVGRGDVFERLLACNMDPGVLRPYRRAKDGKTVVSVLSNKFDPQTGKRLRMERVLANANTTLTKEAWLNFDRTVIDVARQRLSAWNDLRGSAPALTLTDGLGTIMLQQQRRGDITPAVQSMDGLKKGLGDQPEYDTINLPLPITHKDFDFSSRDIAVSARGGQPLDMVNVEMAAYHVADLIEDTVIGNSTPFYYGGAYVYGYLTFPQRITGTTLTTPGGSFDPNVLRNELLANIKLLHGDKKYGPFDLMYGPEWLTYLGQRYSTYESRSAIQVITQDIPQINSATMHDKIPGFKMIMKERNSMTARAVIGMELQTVMWDTDGGFKKNFKVLCIMVPQLRADIDGNCGVLVSDVA